MSRERITIPEEELKFFCDKQFSGVEIADFYCVSQSTIYKRLKKASLKPNGLAAGCCYPTVNMDRRDYRHLIRSEMAELLDEWSQHRIDEQLDVIAQYKQAHLQELIQLQQNLISNNQQPQEEQQLAPTPPLIQESKPNLIQQEIQQLQQSMTTQQPLDYSSGYQHLPPPYENQLTSFGSFFMNHVPQQSTSTVIHPMNY